MKMKLFGRRAQGDDGDVPEGFDWESYVDYYPDLSEAGITTRKAAEAHWVLYGKNENRKYKLKDPLYSFFHLPKTAGTTIREHIKRCMRKGSYVECYIDEGYFKSTDDLREHLENISGDKRLKLLIGHEIKRPVLKYYDREVREVTFLRNPVRQYISLYNHTRNDHANNIPRIHLSAAKDNNQMMSFKEWLHRYRVLPNYMVKWFMEYCSGERLPGKVERHHLEKAKKILSEFYFVGITERKADFDRLYDLLSISREHINENISQKYFSPNAAEMEEAKKIIEELSPLDVELYEYALQLNTKLPAH